MDAAFRKIEVQLERAFMIKGYVKDSEGNGLEGVGLSKDKNNKWNQTATTDTLKTSGGAVTFTSPSAAKR